MTIIFEFSIQVVASADVPLDQLFSTEKKDEGFISDEHRKLMDDLNISPVILQRINFKLKRIEN